MSEQTGQPWWTGLPDDVEPASDTQLANVVRNGLRPGRGSKVLLPWPLMLRVLRRLAEKDAEIASLRAAVADDGSAWRNHYERAEAAEAEVARLREALAKVRDMAPAVADIAEALASVPAVDAGDREPASEHAADGAALIAAERQRQITEEGYTPEHDAHHYVRQFVATAVAYLGGRTDNIGQPWPIKRADSDSGLYQRRDLVKAGALIAAAIDRLTASEVHP